MRNISSISRVVIVYALIVVFCLGITVSVVQADLPSGDVGGGGDGTGTSSGDSGCGDGGTGGGSGDGAGCGSGGTGGGDGG